MRYWRRDTTNGKSQRVPAAANGKAVKGGLLTKAPGAGSGGGLSPTGSAIGGGDLWGHRPLQPLPVATRCRLYFSNRSPVAPRFIHFPFWFLFGHPVPKPESEKKPHRRRAGPEAPSWSSTGSGRVFRFLRLDRFLRPSLFISEPACSPS